MLNRCPKSFYRSPEAAISTAMATARKKKKTLFVSSVIREPDGTGFCISDTCPKLNGKLVVVVEPKNLTLVEVS